MTYDQICQGVYQRLNKNFAPDPVTQARIQTFVNDRYRELMRLPGIDLRGETRTITTESGRARYALPAVVTEIYNITDTTNRVPLTQTTLGWMRLRDPSMPAQQSGVPYYYAIMNEAGIDQQPGVDTPNALQIVSSSPADTQVATLEYRSATTSFQTVTATLTGIVPVTIVATVAEVYRLSVPTVPVGAITVREIVSGNIITVLAGSLTSTKHAWVLHLWPTPGGAYTYAIDYDRPRRPLVAPSDEPALPEEFHTTLVYGACAEEMLKMDDGRAQYYESQYQADVKRLRAFVHQVRGQRLIPTGRRRAGFSTIGPWFPPNDGVVY